MGRASRTGTEGIAITALAVAAKFAIEGEPITAAVAGVIGLLFLVAHDHIELGDLNVTEEDVANVSETISDTATDAVDSIQDSSDEQS